MATELLPEALWIKVRPLLPPHRPHPRGVTNLPMIGCVCGALFLCFARGLPGRCCQPKHLASAVLPAGEIGRAHV